LKKDAKALSYQVLVRKGVFTKKYPHKKSSTAKFEPIFGSITSDFGLEGFCIRTEIFRVRKKFHQSFLVYFHNGKWFYTGGNKEMSSILATKSALVDEPKCGGGGVAGPQPMRPVEEPVLRIWIRRIRLLLGLLDPDRDPVVRGMDPDPSIIKQKL
jgi:hypothetical protein